MEKYRIREVWTTGKKSHFIVEELVIEWSFFGLKYSYKPYIIHWFSNTVVKFKTYKEAKRALMRKIEFNLK